MLCVFLSLSVFSVSIAALAFNVGPLATRWLGDNPHPSELLLNESHCLHVLCEMSQIKVEL